MSGDEHQRTPPPGPDAPDDGGELAGRIVAAAGAADRSGVWWVLRALLAVVAVAYIAVDVVGLLLDDGANSHVAHHLGVFEVAYAVTLLFVAVRPARARALVPFTVVLAVGMALFAVVDIAAGHAFPLAELSHALELAGLVLVWLLATRRGWPGRTRPVGAGPTAGPTLRMVEDDDPA